MNMPGFSAEAALEPNGVRTGLNHMTRETAPGVQLARQCCEACESVCENQGWDSLNCRKCTGACIWCNFRLN